MRRQKIIFLIFVSFVLLTICLGNSVSAQTQRAETAEKSPLLLKVTTPQPTICRGTESISLKLEMSNVSRKPVTIDKNYLWNGSLSVYFSHKKIADGWASGETAQFPYTGDFLQLAPGEKYLESHEFSFVEKGKLEDFFNRIGRYTITVRYRAIDLDDNSPEVRQWLYTKPVATSLEMRIVQCRRK